MTGRTRRRTAGAPRRHTVALATALAAGLGLGGCGYEGPQDLPLPGGVGRDGYEVVVVLEDATNLVAQATCRSGDTVVGSIASVELDEELHARVVCRISEDVALPGNVVATLRETSLLGERYVALDPPRGEAPTGRLAAGTTIPASRTTAQPDTETVLGALSLVLNGGSLGSISVIAEELTAALEQPGDVRSTARRLTSLVQTLDTRRDSLTTALDALARLSTTLADQRGVISEALAAVPEGLAALDRQRPALTRTLRRLSRLSRTAVPLIERSKDATVADLKHLQPVLAQLSTAKDELSRTVERLASFPFSRNALSTIKGDYAGMYGQALIDIDTINALLVSLAELAPGPPVGAPPVPAGAETEKPGKRKPTTIAEVLADLDLTTLLDDAVTGLGETLDLSSLLNPGGVGQPGSGQPGSGQRSSGRVPRDLGELLTGGGR